MKRNVSPILLAYVAVSVLFVASNLVLGPMSGSSSRAMVDFRRNAAQTVGGLIPEGLWQPDHALIKRRVDVLPSVSFLRELGNSIRLALGQTPDWVFTGGRSPISLFLTGELWVSRGVTPRIETEVDRIATVISRYNKQLERDGWKLVVVPVPTKLGIHHDWVRWPIGGGDLLSRDPVPSDRSDEVYHSFLTALSGQGVTSVDLLGVYREAITKSANVVLYPRGESHWSGEGIRLASEATARVIAANSPLKDRSLKRPTFYKIDHVGDLDEAFDPLPWFTTRLRSIWTYKDYLLDGDDGQSYSVPMDPAGLVVAVGTSYTGQYTWIPRPVGFAWQLGLHLENVEVQNRPMAGQGSFKSFGYFWEHRKEIADDFARRKGTGKVRVVVWEMPIRDIPGIGNSTLSWTKKGGWR